MCEREERGRRRGEKQRRKRVGEGRRDKLRLHIFSRPVKSLKACGGRKPRMFSRSFTLTQKNGKKNFDLHFEIGYRRFVFVCNILVLFLHSSFLHPLSLQLWINLFNAIGMINPFLSPSR